jgi:hypothetical protein
MADDVLSFLIMHNFDNDLLHKKHVRFRGIIVIIQIF